MRMSIAIIEKMIKQRRDSISQYEAADRQDLVDVEKFEMSVLQPTCRNSSAKPKSPPPSPKRSPRLAQPVPQDMGKVMGVLKPKLAGRADMGKVSALIKAQLSK